MSPFTPYVSVTPYVSLHTHSLGVQGIVMAPWFVFDPRFFRVRSVQTSTNAECGLSGQLQKHADPTTFNGHTFLPYLCTSLEGHKIIPAEDEPLHVELEAVGGYEGVTKVGVEPKVHIHGEGYSYISAPPIQLRLGHCGP